MKIRKSILIILLSVWAAIAFAATQQTSSTTASSMISDVRAYLNDYNEEDEFYNDGELLQWLNDGMVEIATQTHCLQSTASLNLAASTIEYSISSTYITIDAVIYVDASGVQKGLFRGAPYMVGWVTDRGVPIYWYEWGGKIGVYPPLTARTTETVTIYYVTRPTAIASTGTVTTPAIYDRALMFYMIAQAKLKDRKTAEYEQHMARFEAELARRRADLVNFPEKTDEKIELK